MKTKSRNKSFKHVGELLQLLGQITKNKPTIWFRGQALASWKLQPSIMRAPNSFKDEVVLLKRFKQNAVALMETIPTNESDWLFLMQHHAVPTRLLDWSESPLVALYFAVCPTTNSRDDKKDAALWCLYPHVLNEIVGMHMDSAHDIPSFGHEAELDSYLPSRAAGIATADPKPIALIAPRPFRRLHVQQGVFTLFHRNQTPLEEITDSKGERSHIVKLIIPASAKPKLRQELKLLQFDRLALFPELGNIAQRIEIHKK